MKNIMVNKKVQRKKNKIFLFALKHERTAVGKLYHCSNREKKLCLPLNIKNLPGKEKVKQI